MFQIAIELEVEEKQEIVFIEWVSSFDFACSTAARMVRWYAEHGVVVNRLVMDATNTVLRRYELHPLRKQEVEALNERWKQQKNLSS
jgi:hypothetical protein